MKRIDGRGIEVYMKYLTNDDGAGVAAPGSAGLRAAALGYTHRVWLELVKYATLKDGSFECGFV